MKYISKSLWLLFFSGSDLLRRLSDGGVGDRADLLPVPANGSMVNGPDGKPVGSLLIAQPFTKDEYFQPRPSAASYDGSASASSTLSAQ